MALPTFRAPPAKRRGIGFQGPGPWKAPVNEAALKRDPALHGQQYSITSADPRLDPSWAAIPASPFAHQTDPARQGFAELLYR